MRHGKGYKTCGKLVESGKGLETKGLLEFILWKVMNILCGELESRVSCQYMYYIPSLLSKI